MNNKNKGITLRMKNLKNIIASRVFVSFSAKLENGKSIKGELCSFNRINKKTTRSI